MQKLKVGNVYIAVLRLDRTFPVHTEPIRVLFKYMGITKSQFGTDTFSYMLSEQPGNVSSLPLKDFESNWYIESVPPLEQILYKELIK